MRWKMWWMAMLACGLFGADLADGGCFGRGGRGRWWGMRRLSCAEFVTASCAAGSCPVIVRTVRPDYDAMPPSPADLPPSLPSTPRFEPAPPVAPSGDLP